MKTPTSVNPASGASSDSRTGEDREVTDIGRTTGQPRDEEVLLDAIALRRPGVADMSPEALLRARAQDDLVGMKSGRPL